MNKFGKFLIIFKILISILLPYLLFFKMHAEVLINNANVFKTVGSIYLYSLGLVSLILIISELFLYKFITSRYTKNDIKLQSLNNKLFIYDLVLVCITTVGMIVCIKQIPHFIFQLGVLSGYAFLTIFCILIYMVLTLFILRVLSKKDFINNTELNINNDNVDILEENYLLNINNNPFSYSGRMVRLPFFITNVICKCLVLVAGMLYLFLSIKSGGSYKNLILGCFVLVVFLILILLFFAFIKRLRDVKLSPLFCLLALIPYVGIVLELVLTFKKSKFIS